MAVPRRFVVAPSAATRELWRVAESGEIDELAELLPQAEINARNEHGMTALMRAAYHGRVQMVRALLEHGADPNATRNDNFTALSLAAFFGHSEIVELLIGYGASTDVATRYGTSAHMWAKARSFGDVAQCLQKRRKDPVILPTPPTPMPTRSVHLKPDPEPELEPEPEPEPEPEFKLEPTQPKSQPSLEVKTLSEPPEIWDLVHEAPRNFSAGSTFVARVGSITAGVVFGVAAFLVVAGGAAGYWYWKNRPQTLSKAPATAVTSVTTLRPKASSASSTAPPVTQEAATTPAVTEPAAAAPAAVAPAENPSELPSITVTEPVVPRRTTRRSVIKPQTTQTPIETATTAPPSPTTPKTESQNSSSTTNKPAAPLSPQLITQPKTQQPQQPKAKVIQWP